MMRIFFGTSSLVVGLAAFLGSATLTDAEHHFGSVHYGGRVVPVRVEPMMRPGAVRYEHYVAPAFHGAYRNPYRAEYFRRFRPGYRPYVLGGAQYYGYGSLPVGCQPVVFSGITYYFLDGVYYQPYIYGGQTVYLVAPDPNAGPIVPG